MRDRGSRDALDHTIIAQVQSGDLKCDVILIRPEPGQCRIAAAGSKDIVGHELSHGDGVGNAFEPYPPQRAWETCAVSDCPNGRVGGLSGGVSGDPVVDLQPGVDSNFYGRRDTDANENNISGQLGSVGKNGSCDLRCSC